MYNSFTYAICSALLMSVLSLGGLVLLLLGFIKNKNGTIENVALTVASLALIGDSLIHQLPESFEEKHYSTTVIILYVILGMLITTTIHHICEARLEQEDKKKSLGYSNLVNEAIHNFIDGLALGIAWGSSYESGIAVTIGIAAHEIPQEIGDFAILVSSGFPVHKVIVYNLLISLTCSLGVLTSYLFGISTSRELRSILLPITSGSFLSFGIQILLPQLTGKSTRKTAWLTLFIGTLIIAFAEQHHSSYH